MVSKNAKPQARAISTKQQQKAKAAVSQVVQNDETYVDVLPPFFGSIETELSKEHAKFDEMFCFPLNPAFYKCFTRHPKRMQAVNNFLTQQGLTLTQQQDLSNNLTRKLIEHKFWKEGFDRIIPGYRDADFTE